MNLYLIDDDANILRILTMIIEERGLGVILGTAANGEDALYDIKTLIPDIVFVDLLMPEMDGITFVRKAQQLDLGISFIMLSQVSSKDMIASAYESGIEYYIQKPLNSVEVETVLQKVIHVRTMSRTFQKMHSLFQNEISIPQAVSTPASRRLDDPPHIVRAKNILRQLSIIGDHGTRDILNLIDYLVTHHLEVGTTTLSQLCSQLSDNPKSVEQRIRRTATAGLINLANLGIEDYGNETFIEYSNTLYNFEQVKREMDYIRGNSSRHGNVKMKTFLNSLLSYCNEKH